jgi:superfamily II DNA helicase RecQ
MNPKTNKEQKVVKGWAGVKEDDLVNFDQTIREKFKWPHTPRKFQLDAIISQLLCKDVVVYAGTGFGKMAIAAGPHAHEKAKGTVTFMVSPLIALQEEQVSELRDFCLGIGILTSKIDER